MIFIHARRDELAELYNERLVTTVAKSAHMILTRIIDYRAHDDRTREALTTKLLITETCLRLSTSQLHTIESLAFTLPSGYVVSVYICGVMCTYHRCGVVKSHPMHRLENVISAVQHPHKRHLSANDTLGLALLCT